MTTHARRDWCVKILANGIVRLSFSMHCELIDLGENAESLLRHFLLRIFHKTNGKVSKQVSGPQMCYYEP